MFIMLVGISGSGKSTYTKKLNGTIISSDNYREVLLGDVNNQDNNSQIFETMRKDVINLLENKKDVIYDATNLSRKYRLHLLKELKHKFPNERFECHIIVAHPYDCIRRQELRDRKVPKEVIYKQIAMFQVPHKQFEPWDDIKIINNATVHISIEDYLERTIGFEQTGKYHKEDLYTHIKAVMNNLKDDEELSLVAEWHDIGKLFTRTSKDGNYHFYGHENVSALLYLCENGDLETAFLINMHDVVNQGGRWYKALNNDYKKKLIKFNKADKEGSII